MYLGRELASPKRGHLSTGKYQTYRAGPIVATEITTKGAWPGHSSIQLGSPSTLPTPQLRLVTLEYGVLLPSPVHRARRILDQIEVSHKPLWVVR